MSKHTPRTRRRAQALKSRLSRRTFLGGAGAMVALPFLDSLSPSLARAADNTGPPQRLLYYYVPNGMHMPAWTPTQVGTGYDLPPILAPLAPVQNYVNVITGLENFPANPDGPGDHAAGTGSFITCFHVNKTEGSDIENAISADQVAAQALGGATLFPSLQLGTDGGASTGGCDSGYSCAYSRNISWAGPQTPLPKTVNPRLLFDRLFGGYDAAASQAEQDKRRRYRLSVLDYVLKDAESLKLKLGATDRQKMSDYLDAVRELEKRVTETVAAPLCDVMTAPEGSWSVQERIELFDELMVLAFQCDQSRIISFMNGNAGSNRVHDFLGISEGHHEISHHQSIQSNFDKLEIIDTWEVERLSQLLQRMASVEEEDGSTMLDNTLVFFSSEIEDGNSHSHSNMPILLCGRGGGVTSGRHIVYDNNQPVANLLLDMLQRYGVDVDSFGDSTGPIEGLSES